MSNYQHIPSRALDLISEIGSGIRERVPDRAMNWIETGAALGALKTGQRYATRFARRNPAVVAAAAVAGIGLLAYSVARKRKNQQADDGTIEGTATRIEAEKPASRGNTRRRRRSSSVA